MPDHELRVVADIEAAAVVGADLITSGLRRAVAQRGRAHLAVSGGRTPAVMLRHLAGRDLPWSAVTVHQVDERVAPDGTPQRNLTELRAALAGCPARLHPMPVTAADLTAACAGYAARLPARLDVVHLGLGADGHTASLVPGDPVLDIADRTVAVTARPYQGLPRMTLTYPALDTARALVWLVTGADKAAALQALLAGDPTIPAGRVAVSGTSVVVADAAAVG